MSIHTEPAALAGALKTSVSLRFVVVGALFLAAMIPLALVASVVDERESYFDEAIADIQRSWAGEQRVVGPLLLIPRLDDEGDEAGHVAVMPRTLDIAIDTRHQMRKRGIFETPVFDVELHAEGTFAAQDAADLQARFDNLRFDRATLAVGVSSPQGIRDATLAWGDAQLAASAHSVGPIGGMVTAEPRDAVQGGRFAVQLSLRGSGRFSAVPAGDRSTVAIASTWPHPSFDGRQLPHRHDVRADGFAASWEVHELGRGFPTVLHIPNEQTRSFEDADLGFTVFEPVQLYSSVTRSVKYGVLFVVLTLGALLCMELSMGLRLHFVQYGVTAAALVLFYLTLLALAEHIGFTLGYAIAATVLTAMIGWYLHGATGRRSLTAVGVGVLAALYAVLFGVVRLESFALLVGTGVLLAGLTLLMWATRRLGTPP